MSSSDLHEALFKWPYTEPTDVIVTGSFDSWSQTIHLSRSPQGFAATVKIPWGQKVAYKYIVDGRWTTTDTQPTELDPMGNINNVYNAPARPVQSKVEAPSVIAPTSIQPTPIRSEVKTANRIIASAKETATGMAEAIAPGTTKLSISEPAPTGATVLESTTAMVKDVASTVTESATSTVTAAISAVTTAVAAAAGSVPKDAAFAGHTAEDPTAAPVSHVAQIAPGSVLPPSAATDPVAPLVPVSVLPLSSVTGVPTANDEPATTASEAAVADGTATSNEVPRRDASTHAPVIVNGQATMDEPTAVILPPVTPSEIPAVPVTSNGAEPAPAPSTNGGSYSAGVTVSAVSPARVASQNGHHKEKRLFPTLGRGHRHSSSSSHSEFGEHRSETSSATNTVSSGWKQRKSSFFGKIKDIFHHEHRHKEKVED